MVKKWISPWPIDLKVLKKCFLSYLTMINNVLTGTEIML